MKFAIFITIKRVAIGCLCAGALAAVACADGRGVPTSPSASAAVSSLAATAPGNEGTVRQAVVAAKPAAVVAKGQLPFRGTLEAVEIHTGSFPILFSALSGTGHATHLGRFTATFDFQIDLRTLTTVGSFTLIAANKDSISGTLTGQGTVLNGVLSVVETATITAGTGRFANATGSFTIERVLADPVTHSSSGSFDGTIDFNH